jgi:hypothetical protein
MNHPTKFAPVMSSHRRDAIAVLCPSSIPRLWRSKLKFVAATQCAMHHEDKDGLVTGVRCHGDPGRDEGRTAAKNRSATSDSRRPETTQLKLKARSTSRVSGDRPHPHAQTGTRAQREIQGGGDKVVRGASFQEDEEGGHGLAPL